MTRNRDTRQALRNALASYMTLFAQFLSGLVVTPLIFRSLGASTFGTYVLVTAIIGYLGLLELGIGTAIVRFVAVRAASGKAPPMIEILGSGRRLYAPIAIASTVLLLPVVALIPLLHVAGGASTTDVRIMAASLGVGQSLALLVNVYPAYAYGIGRSDLIFVFSVCTSLATSAVQVGVALGHLGVVALAATTAIAGVASSLLFASFVRRRLLRGERARLRDGSSKTSRELLRYGLKNAGVGGLATIGQFLDPVVIGAFLSARSVAAYAVSAKVATFSKGVATQGSDVLVPTFADANAVRDEDRQFRIFSEAAFFASAVLWPIALVAGLFGRGLLRLWLGHLPAGAYAVLVLLLSAAAVQAVGHIAFVFLNGRGELDVYLRRGTWFALGNLGLSILLTPIIGPAGPAVGSLVAFFLFDALILPREVLRRLGRRWSDMASSGFAALILPLVAAGGVGVVLKLVVSSHTTGTVASAAVTLTTFYVALVACMGGPRRALYVQRFRALRARPKVAEPLISEDGENVTESLLQSAGVPLVEAPDQVGVTEHGASEIRGSQAGD